MQIAYRQSIMKQMTIEQNFNLLIFNKLKLVQAAVSKRNLPVRKGTIFYSQLFAIALFMLSKL